MNKILIGTIFALTVAHTASASIISRGFFDEKMADYAKSSDLTELSNSIGQMLPSSIPVPPNFIEVFATPPEIQIPKTITGLISNIIFAETGFPSIHQLSDILLHGSGLSDGSRMYGLPQITTEVDKIGTVPDGYTNLGDALAAVKITADTAKRLAEQAIPNVLNESSNGKYVLTAEKIGDTATYKWEIIDRTAAESQSE